MTDPLRAADEIVPDEIMAAIGGYRPIPLS
jgi:hypothetical protein